LDAINCDAAKVVATNPDRNVFIVTSYKVASYLSHSTNEPEPWSRLAAPTWEVARKVSCRSALGSHRGVLWSPSIRIKAAATAVDAVTRVDFGEAASDPAHRGGWRAILAVEPRIDEAGPVSLVKFGIGACSIRAAGRMVTL
jgi:hypothetical protein